MAIFCALPRFGFRAEAAGGADAYWASFARDSGNAAVAESKLPISLERTEILLNGQAEKLGGQRARHRGGEDVHGGGNQAGLL